MLAYGTIASSGILSNMSQAILSTERLCLLPLSPEHLALQVELDADPEVMRHLGGSRSRSQAEAALRANLADAERVPGLGSWVGFVADEFVGYWILRPPGYTDEDLVEGCAELGCKILRRHWRKGLGSEGSRELLRHGFEDLGLHRVAAMATAANAASRATLTGLGLLLVREFEADADDFPPGSDLRAVELAITLEDWKAGAENPHAQPPDGDFTPVTERLSP
ncbi:GNAT family N-acetyltransferase [Streptomyces sp. NPDC088788]|uniref:GNAT family N-acetyltransferase n=1 Tax=Streptomyces sp. NPDC088788 TaxID=3365898 RepID=UPI00382B7B24